jgi:hypothetical protein
LEEEKARQEIYKHHLSAQAALAAGDPTVDAPAPFHVFAHFLDDQQHLESKTAAA